MPAQLLALTSGPSILLDKPILLLGRHPECDIQIDSRKISRRHCCIAQVSDYLVVRDLGSTNGIRINGTRVLEGRLTEGDELTIGNHRYQVCWDSAARGADQQRGRLTRETGHHASLRGGDDDELLESCDAPIPLKEPSSPLPGRRAVPPPLPSARPPDLDLSEAMSVAHESPEDASVILPDNLELRPTSDVFPSKSKPPPPPS